MLCAAKLAKEDDSGDSSSDSEDESECDGELTFLRKRLAYL